MSKIISYDFGHSQGNADGSANGILYEYSEVRKYGQVCVNDLASAGYTMINCTPPDGTGMSLGESLYYRANKANNSGSILHLCFHANCFEDPSAHGAEIEVASDESARIANIVLDEICALGFSRRGINRPNLYMTRNTLMPCILTEPFFVSNRQDCNIYNYETLGHAMAKGILKALGDSYIPETKPVNITPQSNAQDTLAEKVTQSAKFVGSRCLELQQKLNKVMGFNLQCDGILGSKTYGALIAFQQKYGLTPDGLAGNQTFSKLDEVIAQMNRPTATPQPSVANSVLLTQRILNRLKITSLSEDGVMGNMTKNAIIKFQSICGIDQDGVWGNQSQNCADQILSKPLCGIPYIQRVPSRYIQWRLGTGIDGVFGNGTASVVRKWQSNNGLSADGIFGNASWTRLIG